MSKYRENKENLSDPNQQAAASQDTREQQKREPIRAEKTVVVTILVHAEAGRSIKTATERTFD